MKLSDSRCLVTFCNNRRKLEKGGSALVLLDLKLGHPTPIDPFGAEVPFVKKLGARGICRHQDGYAVALQTRPFCIASLTGDFEVVKTLTVPDVRGVHSIWSLGDRLALACTAQDQIVAVDDEGRLEVLWSSANAGRDTIHLNSLHGDGHGGLWGTAFGSKRDQLWSSADSGYAFDVRSGEVIMDDLYHPHSLYKTPGGWWVCESSRQQIRGPSQNVGVGEGYVRGLAIRDNELVCGTSVGRTVSHSTGSIVANSADPGRPTGRCTIQVFELVDKHAPSSLRLASYDLSRFGSEIYDVIEAA